MPSRRRLPARHAGLVPLCRTYPKGQGPLCPAAGYCCRHADRRPSPSLPRGARCGGVHTARGAGCPVLRGDATLALAPPVAGAGPGTGQPGRRLRREDLG